MSLSMEVQVLCKVQSIRRGNIEFRMWFLSSSVPIRYQGVLNGVAGPKWVSLSCKDHHSEWGAV